MLDAVLKNKQPLIWRKTRNNRLKLNFLTWGKDHGESSVVYSIAISQGEQNEKGEEDSEGLH